MTATVLWRGCPAEVLSIKPQTTAARRVRGSGDPAAAVTVDPGQGVGSTYGDGAGSAVGEAAGSATTVAMLRTACECHPRLLVLTRADQVLVAS